MFTVIVEDDTNVDEILSLISLKKFVESGVESNFSEATTSSGTLFLYRRDFFSIISVYG